MSLGTPNTVETLQTSLQAKAKTEPGYRFYSLWDKICREDVLAEAYRRCHANAGASGVDGETFDRIEERGVEQWLGKLRKELVAGTYASSPPLRVWIPKSNGGQRPLGIPTIRDRVVQMAVVLVIGPIFEADMLPQQYGFRPGLDAKIAVRRVFWHVRQHRRQEVRGPPRLLHLYSTCSADALSGTQDRRRTGVEDDQTLADCAGRREYLGPSHPDRRSTEKKAGNATRRGKSRRCWPTATSRVS